MRRINKVNLEKEKINGYYLKLLELACDNDDPMMFAILGTEFSKRGYSRDLYAAILAKIYGRRQMAAFILKGVEELIAKMTERIDNE